MLTFLSITVRFLCRYSVFKKLLVVERADRITKYPAECHKVIENLDEKIKKVLFVGDVHGCYDELCEMLELSEVEKSKQDVLVVFTGDLVNKGPKSVETVRHVRRLGEMAHCVRGNHEEAVLSHLRRLKKTSTQPPKKYSWIVELSSEDCKFLEELPFSISMPFLNVVVIHGGLVPGVKLREQHPQDMINMRNYIPEELSGTADIDKGLAWASQWAGPEFVIFGHDARRRLQKYKNAIGLDTGCLYGGALTGLLVDLHDSDPVSSGQLITVKAHMTYVTP